MRTVFCLRRFHAVLLPLLLAAGCASKPSPEANRLPELERASLNNLPATVRLGSFTQVELKSVTVAADARERDADELARRMDGRLRYALDPLWRDVTHVPRDVPFTGGGPGTLLIEPTLMEAKLVSRLNRDMWTWAAGDSYVVVKVTYRDGATGELVAEPQFFRKSELFWASWSGGATDLAVEEDLVRDIAHYTRDNF